MHVEICESCRRIRLVLMGLLIVFAALAGYHWGNIIENMRAGVQEHDVLLLGIVFTLLSAITALWVESVVTRTELAAAMAQQDGERHDLAGQQVGGDGAQVAVRPPWHRQDKDGPVHEADRADPGQQHDLANANGFMPPSMANRSAMRTQARGRGGATNLPDHAVSVGGRELAQLADHADSKDKEAEGDNG